MYHWFVINHHRVAVDSNGFDIKNKNVSIKFNKTLNWWIQITNMQSILSFKWVYTYPHTLYIFSFTRSRPEKFVCFELNFYTFWVNINTYWPYLRYTVCLFLVLRVVTAHFDGKWIFLAINNNDVVNCFLFFGNNCDNEQNIIFPSNKF